MTMERELEILEQIQSNEKITQRDLAYSTGLSLGSINMLLKDMIEKGFIRIEKLNSKSIKYILTPEGMAEKLIKTYQYMTKNYKNIVHMQQTILSILDNKNTVKFIYLYGEQNDIYNIIKNVLNSITSVRNIKYELITDIDRIHLNRDTIVFVWDRQKEKFLYDNNIKSVNILKHML